MATKANTKKEDLTTKVKSLLTEQGVPEKVVNQFSTRVLEPLLKKKPSWVTPEKLADQFMFFYDMGYVIDGKKIYFSYKGVDYQYQFLIEVLNKKFPDSSIYFDVVREGQHFSYKRKGRSIIVEHDTKGVIEGKLDAAYVVITSDGSDNIRVFNKTDLRMAMAQAGQKAVWNNFPVQMALKSVIRSLLNALLGMEFSVLDVIDEQNLEPTKTRKSQYEIYLADIKNAKYKELLLMPSQIENDPVLSKPEVKELLSLIEPAKVSRILAFIDEAKTIKELNKSKAAVNDLGDDEVDKAFAKKQKQLAPKK